MESRRIQTEVFVNIKIQLGMRIPTKRSNDNSCKFFNYIDIGPFLLGYGCFCFLSFEEIDVKNRTFLLFYIGKMVRKMFLNENN